MSAEQQAATAAAVGDGLVGSAAGDPVDPTRERLIDAAALVFAEKGYDRAGVQEIARRAGLTTGAIYGRFTGKAELLQAAIEHRTTDEFDLLFASHRFDGHATDVLKIAGSHLVEPMLGGLVGDSGAGRIDGEAAGEGDDGLPGEGALLLEAFVAGRRDPEVREQVKGLLEERAARMAVLVEAGKADGTVDPDLDTESIVSFAHAVGLGFLLFDAVSMQLPQAKPWQQLIDRLVTSLSAPATPPAPMSEQHPSEQHPSEQHPSTDHASTDHLNPGGNP